MARRPKSDSVQVAIAAFKAVNEPYKWPTDTVDLPAAPEERERAMVIFQGIMTARAKADWRDHDRVLCAQLALVEMSIAKAQSILDEEGFFALGGKSGTARIRNPALDVLATLGGRQLQLVRALGLAGAGTPDAKTIRNSAKAEAEAREARGIGSNALLAGYDDDEFRV